MIEAIESLRAISPLKKENEVQSAADGSAAGMFGSIFQGAIQNVRDTNAELTEAEYLLSTGQLDNPATLTIAASKYQISLDLLIQLRNKALDAYSELTRISM